MKKNYLLKKEFFIVNRQENIKDSYQFTKEIGRGAYGVVYTARQKVFPKSKRVIKRISKRKVKNPTSLYNQIYAMSKLDHPHIIKLYQTFEDDENLFLVMDYCPGGELFYRLANCNHFTENEARGIFRQMVTTVKYMHEQKIMHRDLKLQNFLMVSTQSWDICLIDFGMAFRWKDKIYEQMVSQRQNQLVGTAYYIAPQVIAKKYDERCDIWSLGVILYMMVTGCPPFSGEAEQQVLENISKLQYNFKGPQFKKISPSLVDLLGHMLQPEDKRIELHVILEHKWMKQTALRKDFHLKLNFDKIKSFSKLSHMKKIVSTYIASNLSEKEILKLRQIFELIDQNQDGFITVQELQSFLKVKQKYSVPMADIQKLVNSIDTDTNGKINYNEFIASCLSQSVVTNQQYLRYAFNSFDLNHDGKIQKEEFNKILKAFSVDFQCNQALVQALINENDKNDDGMIDFKQFEASLAQLRNSRDEISQIENN